MSNETIERKLEYGQAKKIECLRQRPKNFWEGNPVYESLSDVEKFILRNRHNSNLDSLTELIRDHFPIPERGRQGRHTHAWRKGSVYLVLRGIRKKLEFAKDLRKKLMGDLEMCRRFFSCPADKPCACGWIDVIGRE